MLKYKYADIRKACEEIWNTRPHKCVICQKPLPTTPYSFIFAHCLPKAQYPEFATNELNIVQVCSIDCHKTVDIRTAKHRPDIIQELEQGKSDLIFNLLT